MTALVFDVAAFQAAFPEFSSTAADTVQAWATLVLNSPMGDAFTNTFGQSDQQLLVAHIGHLLTQAANGDAGAGGALVSASQGSVSASFAQPPVKTALQYYLSSTPYGQMLWANLHLASMGGDYIGGLPERKAFRKVGGVFW